MKLVLIFLVAYSGFSAFAKDFKHSRKIASSGKSEYPITDFDSQDGSGSLRVTGDDAKKLYAFLDIKPEPSAWDGNDSKTVVAVSKNFSGGSCSMETIDVKNSVYICDFYFVRKGFNNTPQ